VPTRQTSINARPSWVFGATALVVFGAFYAFEIVRRISFGFTSVEYILAPLITAGGLLLAAWTLRDFVLDRAGALRGLLVVLLAVGAWALAVNLAETTVFALLTGSSPEIWLAPINLLRFFDKLAGKFFLLAIWAGLYATLVLAFAAHAAARRAERAEALADAAKLRMLRYQLNPHFLFNTLNSLSALVHDGDRARADALIDRLAEFLRRSLDADARETVSMEEEFASGLDYLAIERVRFGERLNVSPVLDPAARDAAVPALILQPILENAVRHAVAARETPVTLRLEVRRNGNRLEILITDDGPGFPEVVPPGRVGLSNTEARLRAAYGEDASLALEDAPAGGAAVRLDLPFQALEGAPR